MIRIIMIAALVLLLDQSSKYLISSNMMLNQSIPLIQNVFHISYIHNYGAAFGILQNQRIFFVVLTLLIAAALLIYYYKFAEHNCLIKWGIALLLGGAMGNLLDRLLKGYVVDFFDFRIWPVFNVADIAVVVGAGLLFLALIRSDRSEGKTDNGDKKRNNS